MLGVIRLIIAGGFLLFIPGYLLTLILFKKLDKLERIALAIGLSICFSVLIGLILGYSTKIGINSINLWVSYILFCVVMLIIYFKRK
ncbi:DUF1616 domain-containing protein [Candidatus Woesearchaeota archaeon]|nr:DUF1616 domain-containing protein [Candidatus Woesearchaeota archaeon]